MMKLYRPLCSDVTLRLAVDISPSYDESDEDCDLDAKTITAFEGRTHGPNDNDDVSQKLSECNRMNGNSPNSNSNSNAYSSLEHHSQALKHHHHQHGHSHHNNNNNNHHSNSRGHHHSCSWYSRHNTPDKTAKDIYNHEHVLNGDGSSDDFQKVPLDSEFKRCVEEEGNDFKNVDSDNDGEDGGNWDNNELSTPTGDNQGDITHQYQQYSDAELSSCLEDARLECEKHHTYSIVDHENDPRGYFGGARFDGKCDNVSQWNIRGEEKGEGNENEMCHDADADEEEEEDEEEESCKGDEDEVEDMNKDIFTSSTFEELPIDLDEDVDVVDKVVMNQSMLASYYGEIDETLLQQTESLAQSMHESIHADEIPDEMTKSIAEEIHDVLVGDDVVPPDVDGPANDVKSHQLPFSYPFTLKHVGYLFDKSRHYFAPAGDKTRTNSTSSCSASSQMEVGNDISNVLQSVQQQPPSSPYKLSKMDSCTEDEEEVLPSSPDRRPKKCSVSTMTAVSSLELEVTHRGLHRFIPRHKDEMNIGIGDPIHVIKECDDLWCEGINLRTGERGIFPAMYANDLNFLEESDDDEEYWKFSMRFLGSVEVTSHKGDETLVKAINKVATSHKGKINSASLSTLEINQYGIRMIDKSKEGHEKDAFSHFFALKNISFCGTHPKNNRYFAFITKHPREYKFACHVFHGDRPTHRARDALGEAFKRFYQEYMAFTHPTEDIYME